MVDLSFSVLDILLLTGVILLFLELEKMDHCESWSTFLFFFYIHMSF